MIKRKRVHNWADLNDALFEDTWNRTIKRHRSTFAYRGMSNVAFDLRNGLSRLGKPYPTMEKNLLKQFKKYAHLHVVERDTEWHWLSVAQHYGLPTRLLDWTFSPLVALHFATEDLSAYGDDAVVWKVNFSATHTLLQQNLTRRLDELGARIFSIDALAETIPDLQSLDGHNVDGYPIAIFFEPPAIDGRIVSQFAYFSVISDPYLPFDDWLKKPHVRAVVDAVKIEIPSRLKWEIRDKLDQSNINERILFPGLGGLCTWLKRHYKPAQD